MKSLRSLPSYRCSVYPSSPSVVVSGIFVLIFFPQLHSSIFLVGSFLFSPGLLQSLDTHEFPASPYTFFSEISIRVVFIFKQISNHYHHLEY